MAEKMKTEDLYKALAVSWTLRAMGKSSHEGFNRCMRHVYEMVSYSAWDKYDMERATLHAHKGLEEFVEDISNEWVKRNDSS